jgi:ABC-type glycerol-3-phosphate transport system substrate-binding protein
MRLPRAVAQDNSITLSLSDPDFLGDLSGVVADFEAAHPGVHVELVGNDARMQPTPGYASTADVLFFDGYDMALNPSDTRAGYILDLAPLINTDTTFNTDDFYPQIWSSFQWDNGIWAIPIAADMMVLLYRQEAFDEAGIAYPSGGWTLDDFTTAVTKLAVKDENGNVTRTGFANSGRIFREGLWRSLMDSDAVDASVIPNQPQLARPDIETIVDTYRQLEEQDIIGGDPSTAAMLVDTARRHPPEGYGWALLPGYRTVLLPYGFAVSGGTQQPQLAYELVKFLSERPELVVSIPARMSMAAASGIPALFPAEQQAMLEQGFANGLSYANMRFMESLNNVNNQDTPTHDALQAEEAQLISDLEAADDLHGTLAFSVNEPVQAVVPPGKIVLNFDMVTYISPLPNQEQWDRVINEFTAADPQVGLVNLNAEFETASDAAAKSDCFYTFDNELATLDNGTVLALDPLVNSDPAFDRADFVGNVLTAVQRNNQLYALPIDIEPFILRYDSARFAAANVPEPSNTWTVTDFANALAALKPDSAGQAPSVDNGNDGTYWMVLIASYGGLPLDYRTDPPIINFTDPANVTAIRQVLNLARDGSIRYSGLGSLDGAMGSFATNTTAIYPSMLNGFGRKIAPGSEPDKAVLFPVGQQYNGLAYNLGVAYISSGAQNPEACYRFISTLARHPELFSSMPARHSQLISPAFQAATSPDVLALYQQVESLLGDARTVPIPVFEKSVKDVSKTLIQHWLFEAFDTYAIDGGDLEAALTDAQTYAQAFQTCAANLPPVRLENDDRSSFIPYVDCAEAADSRLKPILDPIVGR